MIFDIQPCKLYNHQTHLSPLQTPRTPKSKLDTAVAKPVPSKGGCLATRIHCQPDLLQRSYSPSPFVAIIFSKLSLFSTSFKFQPQHLYIYMVSSLHHRLPVSTKILRGNPFFDICDFHPSLASMPLPGTSRENQRLRDGGSFGVSLGCYSNVINVGYTKNWPGEKTHIFFRICECFILVGHGNPSQYNI